jgi:hypothetical protein
MATKRTDLPHSWAIDNWPADVFPNNSTKGRYLVRMHRDELLTQGALSRVGRTLIVMGDGYHKWLQKKAARVPGFDIAANRRDGVISPNNSIDCGLVHFRSLDVAEQQQAVRRLASAGHGDAEIARVTGLHVEQVRRYLAEVAEKGAPA